MLGIAQPVVAKSSKETCLASVYSTKDKDQNGTTTASGRKLDDKVPTMAHRTYDLLGYMKVTNRRTGKVMMLQVIDRGPYVIGRCVDVTPAAAQALGIDGLGEVEVEPMRSK